MVRGSTDEQEQSFATYISRYLRPVVERYGACGVENKLGGASISFALAVARSVEKKARDVV